MIFRKSVLKTQVSLNSNTNNGYFTWRPICIFIISLSFLRRKRSVSDKHCRENQNTLCVQLHFFRNSCHLWDNV